MNKLLLSFAFCLTTITSFAQEAADRMMVHQKDGSVRSYAISNVDSVTFGKSDVQGDVTVTVLATMAVWRMDLPQCRRAAETATLLSFPMTAP